MPLKGKYLQYRSEITFEIFEKIYNKLIEEKWCCKNSIKTEYPWFAKHGYITHEEPQEQRNFATHTCIYGLEETTVQEILGYDPFVKEEFTLPKNWRLKITKENSEIINNWRNNVKEISNTCSDAFIGESGLGVSDDWGIEITFEQFKKYVLKEIVPEYVELLEGFDSTRTGKIFDTKNVIPLMNGWSSSWTWESIFKDDLQKVYFKPSTKEAFDAQNHPKSIEKWSAGSYVVFLNSEIQLNGFNKGDIQQIREYNSLSITYYSGAGNTVSNKGISEQIKWFATKSEAQEFAKTLVEPVKKEVKQPLKQAVHCKTQEEWDFVSEKINYKFTTYFKLGYNDTINVNSNTCECKKFYNNSNYNLLSFQEWCDLNGYKMEKEVKFKIGDWVCNKSMPYIIGKIDQIKGELVYYRGCDEKENVRHATPEEINNHLISIGQIPNKEKYEYQGEYKSQNSHLIDYGIKIHEEFFGNSKAQSLPKMILSIDDEELPMVNIIKTKTVNLLNND